MADNTAIEWTDATWNPITGCSVVSPGCTNCYAMKLAGTRLKHHPTRQGLTRDSKAGPVWTGEVRFNEATLDQPLRWKRPRKIFVCAHGDLFHESVPDAWIDRIYAVMAVSYRHIYQVLTKRSARMRAYLSDPDTARRIWALVVGETPGTTRGGMINESGAQYSGQEWPLSNVWLGVSAEDQARADERIPDLLATPAEVRWLSAEPLLGPIDLCNLAAAYPSHRELGYRINALNGRLMSGNGPKAISLLPAFGDYNRLDWVVAGGESGLGARGMHPDWVRSLRDQCAVADVAFLFKQWGEWAPSTLEASLGNPRSGWRSLKGHPHIARGSELTIEAGAAFIAAIGKKAAGRLLDGVQHDGYPDGRQ